MPKTPKHTPDRIAQQTIKYPAWLAGLGVKDEATRAGKGLFPKSDGWYKTFDRKTRYVCKPCPLAEALPVLAKRLEVWTAAKAGMVKPVSFVVMTVAQAVAMYLDHLRQRVRGEGSKKMEPVTFNDNLNTLALFVYYCGQTLALDDLGPAQFSGFLKMEDVRGKAQTTKNRHIIYVKAFANWCFKAGHRKHPVNFGPDFQVRTGGGVGAGQLDKFREPWEIREAMREFAGDPMFHAIAHLGLNGAFNSKDCGTLTMTAVSIKDRLIDFRRGKTGVGRLVYMLPETIAALEVWLAIRPQPAEDAYADLVFLRSDGTPIYRRPVADGACRYDKLSQDWSHRVGWGYTCLRTTWATYADSWADQLAVDVVMGHKSGHETKTTRRKNYTKRLDPERIRPLCEHVWSLVFGPIGPLPRPSRRP